MATECPQEEDTCGMCGENHCTTMCRVDDPNCYYCANCKVKGHAAWSWECPIFISKWDQHKKCNEESKYRFYPMDDPLTWEKINDQANESNDQANEWNEPQHNGNRNYKSFTNQNPPPPRQHRPTQPRPTYKCPCHSNCPRYPNNIPLGRQSRLTDMWVNQDSDNPEPQPQHIQPTTSQLNSTFSSKDSFFMTLNYIQDSNAASGWD